MADLADVDAEILREEVKAHYATAARSAGGRVAEGTLSQGCGCGPDGCPCCGDGSTEVWGSSLYEASVRAEAPEAAVLASLGCGNPTAVAELRRGETVLDLGSGGGLDVILSARRVGPEGKAYGLDMTEEMLALALRNKEAAGVSNVEFLKGHIEDIPLPAETVDVIISNCVINLSADKRRVFGEAFRVLRPGGRFAVSDVVADRPHDARPVDPALWSACLAGALTRVDYRAGLEAAGFADVEVVESHRVGEGFGSATIRARKPAGTDRGRAEPAATDRGRAEPAATALETGERPRPTSLSQLGPNCCC